MRRTDEQFYAEVLLRAGQRKSRQKKRRRAWLLTVPAILAAAALTAILPGILFRAGSPAPAEPEPTAAVSTEEASTEELPPSEAAPEQAEEPGAAAPETMSIIRADGTPLPAADAEKTVALLTYTLRRGVPAQSGAEEAAAADGTIRFAVTAPETADLYRADGEVPSGAAAGSPLTTRWLLTRDGELFCEETGAALRADAEILSLLLTLLG